MHACDVCDFGSVSGFEKQFLVCPSNPAQAPSPVRRRIAVPLVVHARSYENGHAVDCNIDCLLNSLERSLSGFVCGSGNIIAFFLVHIQNLRRKIREAY